jgi:hypothetical protein
LLFLWAVNPVEPNLVQLLASVQDFDGIAIGNANYGAIVLSGRYGRQGS